MCESATEPLLTDEQEAALASDAGPPWPWSAVRAALPALLVVGVAALELRAFLAAGLPISFDAHSHLAMSSMVARGLAEGTLPIWSNDWYGGFRLLEFYSPAFHLLVGALGWTLGDVVAASKLVLWLGQILSALAFYLLMRRVSHLAWVGVFAACLLLRSVELQMVIGVIGNQPTLFIYVAGPLWMACLFGEGSDSRALARIAAMQSLLLAAMMAAHLSNTLTLLPSLLVFAALRTWQRSETRVQMLRQTIAVGGGVIGAFVLTAFETWPMLSDLDAVSLSLVGEIYAGPALDFSPVAVLLGLEGYSYGMPFVRTPGLMWLALGAMGIVWSLYENGRPWRPFVAALATSLLVSTLLGERAVVGVVLFLLPLCAAPVALLARHVGERAWPPARSILPLSAAALALLLPSAGSLPTAPYAPTDALSPYERLPETPTRSRTFDVTPSSISLDGFYGPGAYSPMMSGRSIPFGGFPQGAPIGTNVVMSLFSEVVEVFRGPGTRLTEEVADILYLAHVGFLVDRSWRARDPSNRSARVVLPNVVRLAENASIGRRIDDEIYVMRYASPAIFAPKVELLPAAYRGNDESNYSLIPSLVAKWRANPVEKGSDPALGLLHRTGVRRDGETLLPLVRALRLDRQAGLAERFYTEAELQGPLASARGVARFEVLVHREDLSVVEIVAQSSQSGFVRVSQSFDPGLRVAVDGEPVAAVADALGGGVIVAFPAGEHTITIRGPSAVLRNTLLALSIGVSMALGAWLVVGRPRVVGKIASVRAHSES